MGRSHARMIHVGEVANWNVFFFSSYRPVSSHIPSSKEANTKLAHLSQPVFSYSYSFQPAL